MPTKNAPLCNAASTKQCTKTTFGMRVKGVLLPPFFSALDQTLRCDVRVVLLGSTYCYSAICIYKCITNACSIPSVFCVKILSKCICI